MTLPSEIIEMANAYPMAQRTPLVESQSQNSSGISTNYNNIAIIALILLIAASVCLYRKNKNH